MPESAVNLSNNAQDDDDYLMSKYGSAPPNQPTLKEGSLDYNWMDTLTKKFEMGSEQVANSRHSAWLMGPGGVNLSDDDELKMLKTGAQKVQTGFSPSEYEAQPWALRAVGDALETTPGIADAVGQGAVGGAITAGASVLASRVVPHPLVQASAGTLGFGRGYSLGSAKSIWEQSAGSMYSELRIGGVKRDTAKLLAYTFGSLNASLEFIGMKAIQRVAKGSFLKAQRTAMQKTLETPFVKSIKKNMLGRLGLDIAGNVAVQTAATGGRQVSSELAKVTAAILEKAPLDTYTNYDSASTNIYNAMIQALGASLVLGPAGTVGGHVLGTVSGTLKGRAKKGAEKINVQVLNELKESTPLEILQKLNEGLKDLPNAWENPNEKSSVAYDAQGNPYIKTSVTSTGQLTMDAIVKTPQSAIQEGLQSIYPIEDVVQTPEGFNPISSEEPTAQLRLPLVDWRPLNATETQARLNQLASDLRTLNKEGKRLEAQITLDEAQGKNGFKNIEKWQKLQESIQDLESQRDILESGLGTTDVEESRYGKLRMKTLNKLFDTLTAQATKLAETVKLAKESKQQSLLKGITTGVSQTRIQIRRMQADLKNLVKTVTTDKNIQAQVDKYIAGVTTPEQMAKAVQEIKTRTLALEKIKSEKAQSLQREKVFEKVKKLIDGQRIRIQSGHPTSPLPPDVTARLSTLRGYLTDEATLKAAEFQFMVEHGATPITELSPDLREQMQLQTMARALYNGDALSQNVTAGNIAQWVLEGKAAIEQKQAALQAEADEAISLAKTSMNIQPKTTQKFVQNTGEKSMHALRTALGQWATWNRLTNALSSKDPNHVLTQITDETRPRREYIAQKELAVINFMRAIHQRVGDPNLLQKFLDYQNTERAVTYTAADGKATTVSLNKMQMLDVVMKFRDESLHSSLREGNKWTLPGDTAPGESFIERVQSDLNPKDMALIDGVLDFYKDYYASINAIYRREYGVDLPQRDNYSPVSRQGYAVDAPLSVDGVQFYSMLPGSAKTREDSLLPIVPRNPIEVAQAHIDQWEYWKAYTPKLRQINAILQNPEIRQHIREEYGSGTLHVMENFVSRWMANDPIPNDPSSSLWSAIRTDLSRHALGFNYVESLATQLTSGTALWAGHNPGEIANGMKETVLHPVRLEKALRSSPILKHRFNEGVNIDVSRALHSNGLLSETLSHLVGVKTDSDSVKTASLYNRFMFAGIQYGDAGVARIFGGPVYFAELARGKTSEEALITVERLMEQTQQGSSVSQTPVMYTNPFVRTTIGLFNQQPTQLLNQSMSHVEDFYAGKKGAKEWATLGHQMAATWVVPGLLYGLVKTVPSWMAPPDDDEDRKRTQVYDIAGQVILSHLGGAPLAGDALQMAWFQAAKPLIGVDMSAKSDYMGRNPILETFVNNPYKALSAWGAHDKEMDKLIPNLDPLQEEMKRTQAELKTGRAITGVLGIPRRFTDIPLGALERASQGDFVGAAQAVGGWTPGNVMQRSSKAESLFPSPLSDLNTNETPYDTIETFFSNLLQNQKTEDPAKAKAKQDAEIDEFVRSLNPNANGQPGPP